MTVAVSSVRAHQQQGGSVAASILPADWIHAFDLYGSQQQLGTVQVVRVEDRPFKQALRITTTPGSTTEWNVQIRAQTTEPIKAGDVLLAKFWIRCLDSMTGEGFTTFLVELARPGWDKAVELRASAGKQWQEYVVPFRAQHAYARGDAQVCFRVGYDRQSIELGGFELVSYGTSVNVEDLPRTRVTYAGREPDADWRSIALDRIEKLRKGDLKVQVRDPSGNPIDGAKVRARMTRHAFGFGCAVAAEELLGAAPDNRHYRDTFEKLFNRAVFENDLKWPQTYNGIPDRVDQAMAWLRQRNIAVRGHCLVWPSWRWLPRDLRRFEDSPQELRRRAAAHISDIVTHFGGQLYQWDVINEVYSNHELIDILGKDVMIEWFKLARQADPTCKLFLNDYGILEGGGTDRAHQDEFYETIRWLRDGGAPIDGIGIQSHFGLTLTPPTRMLKILDRFSELGLPIESTEVSLNINDRELQADFMRDYMISVFSHPNVHSIMLWGFWEGRHWRPDAALYDNNWKLRPHGQVWIDLVHERWRTDATAQTDHSGHAVTRGFCGDYDVTVTSPDGARTKQVRVELPRDGRTIQVVLE
jgi:GH35 family endo-1,4-beta-xylanase